MSKLVPCCVLLCLSLTSCLTIVESYVINKDGSGSMRFTIDMSEMEVLLSYADQESPQSAVGDLSFIEVVKQLKQLPGIHNVVLLDEPESYRWGLSYDFDHTVALNKALNLLLLKEPSQTDVHPFVEYHGHQFRSLHTMNKFITSDRLHEDERLAPLAEQLMKKMQYQVHFTFARPIKVVYAEQEVRLEERIPKSLHLESSFWDLEQNPRILDATLILK